MASFVARLIPGVASSNLAIGTACTFVLVSGLVSFTMDRSSSVVAPLQAELHLRGTIAPADAPYRAAPSQPGTVGPSILARL